jgi:hypothetical protein
VDTAADHPGRCQDRRPTARDAVLACRARSSLLPGKGSVRERARMGIDVLTFGSILVHAPILR